MNSTFYSLRWLVLLLLTNQLLAAQSRWPADDYFVLETKRIADGSLKSIHTGGDWETNAPEYRRQLREMLGLDPWPERTPMNPVITGRMEEAEFTVENLHFQSMPGLYVTGNLYLPKNRTSKAPAILYVCGHGRVVKDGVSFGNKVHYQHHGAWLARHGYVCLVIDTIQLGEIKGMHHGTYRHGEWWWNSRGYTPAGVEAWNSIRAIDYLQSRPEVEGERIGMTGRSGGGAYTWWTAAIDERVKVAAPVAGITDLQNHVVDGVVEGHCDCMYMVNTYRWDYGQVAALVAPRPLLICNTDKDPIFPLDGVIRVYNAARRIYSLVGAESNIGLLITEGPHQDTQELQVPVLRWFDRFLMETNRPIEIAARPFFEPELLKVFRQLPEYEVVTSIQRSFVPTGAAGTKRGRDELKRVLRAKVFAGWPEEAIGSDSRSIFSNRVANVAFEVVEFDSQPGVRLKLWVMRPANDAVNTVDLRVLDEAGGLSASMRLGRFFGEPSNVGPRSVPDSAGEKQLLDQLLTERKAVVLLAPRGIGVNRPELTDQQFTHWRRRFMLLGQTLDGMRVWDVNRTVDVLNELGGIRGKPVTIQAAGDMAVNVVLARLFMEQPVALKLEGLPASFMEGPDYLNIVKLTDLSEIMQQAGVKN